MLAVVILLLFIGAIYNVYDNNRFIVAEQSISLTNLPESFDGYRILQISDLHGKYFGEQQTELLDAINGMGYDCILFTGDMNKYENSNTTSSQAILELLNGIENKETVFWIDGNTGPFAIETVNGSCTGKLTDMGKTIEQAGSKILLSPVEITKGDDSIWFVPELCQSDIQMNYSDSNRGYV